MIEFSRTQLNATQVIVGEKASPTGSAYFVIYERGVRLAPYRATHREAELDAQVRTPAQRADIEKFYAHKPEAVAWRADNAKPARQIPSKACNGMRPAESNCV